MFRGKYRPNGDSRISLNNCRKITFYVAQSGDPCVHFTCFRTYLVTSGGELRIGLDNLDRTYNKATQVGKLWRGHEKDNKCRSTDVTYRTRGILLHSHGWQHNLAETHNHTNLKTRHFLTIICSKTRLCKQLTYISWDSVSLS